MVNQVTADPVAIWHSPKRSATRAESVRATVGPGTSSACPVDGPLQAWTVGEKPERCFKLIEAWLPGKWFHAPFLIWAQLVAPENHPRWEAGFPTMDQWVLSRAGESCEPFLPELVLLGCQAVLRPPANYLTVCLTWDDCVLSGCGKLITALGYGLLEESTSEEMECRGWSKPRFTLHAQPCLDSPRSQSTAEPLAEQRLASCTLGPVPVRPLPPWWPAQG